MCEKYIVSGGSVMDAKRLLESSSRQKNCPVRQDAKPLSHSATFVPQSGASHTLVK